MSNRGLLVSFTISCGLHLVLLFGSSAASSWWQSPPTPPPPRLIYELEAAQRQLQQLHAELDRAQREAAATSAGPRSSIGQQTQIRIPDQPILASRTSDEALAIRSSVIDLTNLVDASRGDPVLLTYFSAIRQQIQAAANRYPWSAREVANGLIYVSFALAANGTIADTRVVSEKSVSAPSLREIAIQIVQSAAPFPAFPPSLQERHKTVVVPLEFLLGS